MAKNKKGKSGVVYSTNPEFEYKDGYGNEDTLDPSDQLLYVSRDMKKRKGKVATIVEGFVGSNDDLKDLGKKLKTKLGVGGTAKDGEIIIQGDFKTKVKEILEKENFKVKLKGG